jgi:hypothetical protein
MVYILHYLVQALSGDKMIVPISSCCKGASCPVFLRVFSSVFFRFVKKKKNYNFKSTLLSRFYDLKGHNMSPSTLKIHLKSVLFHKSCRNLCVGMPRCIHDTFQWFCLFTNFMSDFAFRKICQKMSGILGKNHLYPCCWNNE